MIPAEDIVSAMFAAMMESSALGQAQQGKLDAD